MTPRPDTSSRAAPSAEAGGVVVAAVRDKATLGNAPPESAAVTALSLVQEAANEPATMAVAAMTITRRLRLETVSVDTRIDAGRMGMVPAVIRCGDAGTSAAR